MFIASFLFFSLQAATQQPNATPDTAVARHIASVSSYTPHRVYKSGKKRFTDFETMLAEASRQEVVFLGEQHDDPGTHRLERAALEGIGRRQPKIVLSLEMFERDVQAKLDDYLAGRLSEADFLKSARPWPRYATDYRPLVELAKAKGWPVVASNVPRRLASLVGRRGLSAVDSLPAADRAFIATELQCPRDKYYDRFKESMGDMSGHGQAKLPADSVERMVSRFYQAQCVKDETMAEAIAVARTKHPDAVIVHVNGAFHSDYGQGTVNRVTRRVRSRVALVSFVPVENLDVADGKKHRKQADYIAFTLKPPAPPKAAAPAAVPPAAPPAAPAPEPKPPQDR